MNNTFPSRPFIAGPPVARIGVFDSGFGGLTVLRALTTALPSADYLYFGDSARLPYGSKSAETVTHYTAAALKFLAEAGAELNIIACNTASALALPRLQGSTAVPIMGVVEPGAQAVARVAGPNSTVLVLATEATVASGAYVAACAAHGLQALQKACPLLVPLIEEGWTDGSITEQVARVYLGEALGTAEHAEISADLLARDGLEPAVRPAAILLGCTHYPLLRPLLTRVISSLLGEVPIVDAAEAAARQVAARFPEGGDLERSPALKFFTTDSPEKFKRLGVRFLGRAIDSVTTVDLDS